LEKLETELADVRVELARSESELRASRGRMETAIDALAALEPQRLELEQDRERMRTEQNEARAAAAAAQQHARDLAVQVESRRSSHTALVTRWAVSRKQLEDLHARRLELLAQIAEGRSAACRGAAQAGARTAPARGGSRRNCAPRESPATSWTACCVSMKRHGVAVDQRLETARAGLDEARLAAQQVRNPPRGRGGAAHGDQFRIRGAGWRRLQADATVEAWESQLEDTKGKIERLGQVNLAAIGEFKEQSERKESNLDRQCKDFDPPPLETLESAMRKIDRETRTRFQDTFDRGQRRPQGKISASLWRRACVPGIDGRDSNAAGVSVMARPPGSATAPSANCRAGRRP